ncbi:adhesin, partial [Escherichia coli]|nr:adhesin [Escherichia coli]
MNKIFKVIWNPATGSYTVASETAKSRGKKSGRSKLLISALVAGGLLSSFGASAGNQSGTGVDTGGVVGNLWIAIGEGSRASNDEHDTSSIAIGPYSKALASGATAIGYNSSAGNWALALGQNSNASGDRSMAVGNTAISTGQFAMAFGGAATAEGVSSIAFGRESKATKDYATALGYKSNANGLYSLAIGMEAKADGTDSLALGRLSAASAANAIAMGAESKAAENATAVGTKAEANGINSIALGSGSVANTDNTIALGNQSQAVAAGTIAIGQDSKADGANAIALGNGSITGGVNAIALGQGSYAGLENGTAIGAQASAQGKNSVALGAGSVATDADTVSVGNATAQRKIVNMAKGDIDSGSTDAINGSQLYAISKSVADHLGGGATVNSRGVVTSPNYKLKNGIYGNVGDALADLNTNTIQWDALKKVYSAAHGTDTTSTITNVKDGAISDTSTDAVNGSQLNTTNTNVTNL